MHSAQPLKFVTRQLAGHAGKACLHPRHALLKRPQHRGLRALSHDRRKAETVMARTQAGHLSDFGRRPKPAKAAVCRLTKSITPIELKEPW